jgi:hypothetical protein
MVLKWAKRKQRDIIIQHICHQKSQGRGDKKKKSFATCGSQLIVSFATILNCKIVANNKKLRKTFFKNINNNNIIIIVIIYFASGSPKERVVGPLKPFLYDYYYLLFILFIYLHIGLGLKAPLFSFLYFFLFLFIG